MPHTSSSRNSNSNPVPTNNNGKFGLFEHSVPPSLINESSKNVSAIEVFMVIMQQLDAPYRRSDWGTTFRRWSSSEQPGWTIYLHETKYCPLRGKLDFWDSADAWLNFFRPWRAVIKGRGHNRKSGNYNRPLSERPSHRQSNRKQSPFGANEDEKEKLRTAHRERFPAQIWR